MVCYFVAPKQKKHDCNCFFKQSCLRQVEIQDPWQTYVHGGKNAIATKLTKVCTKKRAFDAAVHVQRLG